MMSPFDCVSLPLTTFAPPTRSPRSVSTRTRTLRSGRTSAWSSCRARSRTSSRPGTSSVMCPAKVGAPDRQGEGRAPEPSRCGFQLLGFCFRVSENLRLSGHHAHRERRVVLPGPDDGGGEGAGGQRCTFHCCSLVCPPGGSVSSCMTLAFLNERFYSFSVFHSSTLFFYFDPLMAHHRPPPLFGP